MPRSITRACYVLTATIFLLGGCSKETPHSSPPPQTVSVRQENGSARMPAQTGEELFKQFCFNCHPDGGNVSDRKRTLHGSDLRKESITAPQDIVSIMRNPRSRMIRFDVQTISDSDALLIAEYVLSTFR